MTLDIINYQENLKENWNNLLHNSAYAWFWHSRQYIDFVMEINVNKNIKDLSFFILDDANFVAACPLFLECTSDNQNRFLCGDINNEFPALNKSLSPKRIKVISDYYFNYLESLASDLDVSELQMRISPQCESHIGANKLYSSPLPSYGFWEIPSHTQIIDTCMSIPILWGNIRKGHKSAIKKADKLGLKVQLYDCSNIRKEIIENYMKLHILDSGGSTRSMRSFEIMYDWIVQGDAMLFQGVFEDEVIGYTLLITSKECCYYGSSCRLPGFKNFDPIHAMQWYAICTLKERNIKYYDLGIQVYGEQYGSMPSEKEINISRFKRGFGGYPIPIYSGMKYYK